VSAFVWGRPNLDSAWCADFSIPPLPSFLQVFETLYGKHAAALYAQAADFNKTARFYYMKAQDAYYLANAQVSGSYRCLWISQLHPSVSCLHIACSPARPPPPREFASRCAAGVSPLRPFVCVTLTVVCLYLCRPRTTTGGARAGSGTTSTAASRRTVVGVFLRVGARVLSLGRVRVGS